MTKKKIGIITILKVNNYGAELQAYAAQKVLQLMGYDAEIIDYLFYKNTNHKRTRMSAPTAKMSIRKHLSERIYPIVAHWKSRHFRKAQNERNAKFEKFHKEYTRMSACYDTLDKLKSAKLDYDVLMTGSDQVWNPGIYSSLDPYLLKFGDENIKRIAYAASFGVSQVPDDVTDYYENLPEYEYYIFRYGEERLKIDDFSDEEFYTIVHADGVSVGNSFEHSYYYISRESPDGVYNFHDDITVTPSRVYACGGSYNYQLHTDELERKLLKYAKEYERLYPEEEEEPET